MEMLSEVVRVDGEHADILYDALITVSMKEKKKQLMLNKQTCQSNLGR